MSPIAEILTADPMRYRDAGTNTWLPADQIAELLCTPRVVPNPTPQQTVPRVPCEADLDSSLGIISDESMARIVATPIFEGFISAVKGGDRGATLRLIVAGKKSGTITADEYTALMAVFAGTVPDPSWQPTITLPPALPRVNVSEIEAALQEIN